MVSIKFWFIEKGQKVVITEGLSRVPCQHEKIKFQDHEWEMTVSQVTHTPVTENNTTVATCFLTW